MSLTKSILILLLVVAAVWTTSLPATAATCRDVEGHAICIVTIKRSAKYHYRYRTVISIDGEKQPLAIYNCRDRTITRKNKYPIPFKPDDGGNFVCCLFNF